MSAYKTTVWRVNPTAIYVLEKEMVMKFTVSGAEGNSSIAFQQEISC